MQISAGFQDLSLAERGGRRRDFHDLGVNTRQNLDHVKESKTGGPHGHSPGTSPEPGAWLRLAVWPGPCRRLCLLASPLGLGAGGLELPAFQGCCIENSVDRWELPAENRFCCLLCGCRWGPQSWRCEHSAMWVAAAGPVSVVPCCRPAQHGSRGRARVSRRCG